MSYYCEICGQKFKTPTGSSNKRHLNGKRHKEALASKDIKVSKPVSNPIYEILLFVILQNSKAIKYSHILKFFSSFGIKTEVTLNTIIKKIKDGDLIYKGNFEQDYENILKVILNLPKINYPLTLSVKEAFEKFQDFGFKYPTELVKFFESISQKYPEFLSLSSSKIAERPDLITFKQIFINNLIFHPKNNWYLK